MPDEIPAYNLENAVKRLQEEKPKYNCYNFEYCNYSEKTTTDFAKVHYSVLA